MDLQSSMGTAGQTFKSMFKGMTDDMQMCIQNCLQCFQTCEQMVNHCLENGGAHAEARHIALLRDCASVCETSAKLMMHESPYHARMCGLCAEVCQACAIDCDRLADDAMMKMCADVCRRCLDSCQKMSMH